MKNRWEEYFNTRLNVSNGKGQLQETYKTRGPINQISRNGIKKAMSKMNLGKAAGPFEVAMELIKTMGERGEE